MDALSFRSDVISSIEILSLQNQPGALRHCGGAASAARCCRTAWSGGGIQHTQRASLTGSREGPGLTEKSPSPVPLLHIAALSRPTRILPGQNIKPLWRCSISRGMLSHRLLEERGGVFV